MVALHPDPHGQDGGRIAHIEHICQIASRA
jgi:hypothetical protein